MANSERKRIAVLFGGRSVEHEISIITGLQLIEAMDTVSLEPVPVYITTDGRWYTGDELLRRDFYKGLPGCLSSLKEVVLMPIPGKGG
ncbi:MAG TPA: D-alanine--D-alanine ligase, partial [Candidatus Melainabacteria bacterium]|nr:D-alanine--D-alanine ligase [Candidatus Melainabacteria bacterium]